MKPGSVGCLVLLLAACGSSSTGLSAFASGYAASYCHFAYHCCTPSDRANPEDPFAITAMTEHTLGFASEQGCTTSFGVQVEVALQQYEDSVSGKRMSYDQADGEACLSAMTATAAACDPNAFWAASQTGGACDVRVFFTGLVPATGDCTMNGDCAAAGSNCDPVDGGIVSEGDTPEVVTGAAACTAPLPVGAMCTEDDCVAGACCSFFSYLSSNCLAYVAEGAMCDPGCETAPCDPSTDYCDVVGTGDCQPLIASGGACNPNNEGTDCQGFNCVPDLSDETGNTGTCQSDTPVIQICVGNPNGF